MKKTLGDLTDQTQTALDPILIAGPTASGKSALALSLAGALNGAVINADSMQVYKDLRIITARPSPEEERCVPHHLYGVVPGQESYSTGGWLRDIADVLERVRGEGRRPVLVGGTGLYFKALTEGFAEMPEIDPDIRERCRALASDGGMDAVRADLAKHDPNGAETLIDLQRLTRALEVVLSTGRTIAHWQSEATAPPLLCLDQTVPLVLAPARPWLHARIAARAQIMLGEDGRNEVSRLLDQNLDPQLPLMRAIGVKEIGDLLSGGVDETTAHERITIATRQYAKRQDTWFRNQMPDWNRLYPHTWDTVENVLDLPVNTAPQPV